MWIRASLVFALRTSRSSMPRRCCSWRRASMCAWKSAFRARHMWCTTPLKRSNGVGGVLWLAKKTG